jgi:hypothetical protein
VATVGPTVEFPDIEAHAVQGFVLVPADVDFSATSIEIRFRPPVPVTLAVESFNGYLITFVPPRPLPISGLVIDPSSTVDARGAKLAFQAYGITVDLAGVTVGPQSKLVLALSF